MTRVYVDQKRISQILINIVSNSIKFTPKNGTIYVTFAALASKRRKQHICIGED